MNDFIDREFLQRAALIVGGDVPSHEEAVYGFGGSIDVDPVDPVLSRDSSELKVGNCGVPRMLVREWSPGCGRRLGSKVSRS